MPSDNFDKNSSGVPIKNNTQALLFKHDLATKIALKHYLRGILEKSENSTFGLLLENLKILFSEIKFGIGN